MPESTNIERLDKLVDQMIIAESGGDPKAVSPVGAKGLMQVMDATARDPGFGVTPLKNPFDPAENVRFGQEYINAMLRRYDGDEEAALIAYNAGPGNADKWLKAGRDYAALPDRKQTEPYVRKILRGTNK